MSVGVMTETKTESTAPAAETAAAAKPDADNSIPVSRASVSHHSPFSFYCLCHGLMDLSTRRLYVVYIFDMLSAVYYM